MAHQDSTRILENWSCGICYAVQSVPSPSRNVTKLSLDVSVFGKCWRRCWNDRGPYHHYLISPECSKSWFFFIMALCDHPGNAPEEIMFFNGSRKYTLRREKLMTLLNFLFEIPWQEANLDSALELMSLINSIIYHGFRTTLLDIIVQTNGLTSSKLFSLKFDVLKKGMEKRGMLSIMRW